MIKQNKIGGNGGQESCELSKCICKNEENAPTTTTVERGVSPLFLITSVLFCCHHLLSRRWGARSTKETRSRPSCRGHE